ncbi:MAG: serine acetyltransferase [Victivallales bacterium]|nr:serine acetyltransferase [Victivallales bacterium]
MSDNTEELGRVWNVDTANAVSAALCQQYDRGAGVSYAERFSIPQRAAIIDILEDLSELLFPGYAGRRNISSLGEYFSTGTLLDSVHTKLTAQIRMAFSYKCDERQLGVDCEKHSSDVAAELLKKLPDIRNLLMDDVQAAIDGDPATQSVDEIILAYPGFKCICVHRIAHELYVAKVPLLPRVMSEYAHTITGIDINPGAQIGRHFFIDHGTGVVVGETAVIGDNVKLYQGVTLGALSFPKDASGKLLKGHKRHPNIEDNVTIYAESTILGNVTIGHDSVIGGNVWLTESVPPFSKVTVEPAKVSIVSKKSAH